MRFIKSNITAVREWAKIWQTQWHSISESDGRDDENFITFVPWSSCQVHWFLGMSNFSKGWTLLVDCYTLKTCTLLTWWTYTGDSFLIRVSFIKTNLKSTGNSTGLRIQVTWFVIWFPFDQCSLCACKNCVSKYEMLVWFRRNNDKTEAFRAGSEDIIIIVGCQHDCYYYYGYE